MSEIYLNPVGSYLLVALVAAVLLGLLLIGPDRTKTTPRQRLALAGVRLAVVLLVIVAMLRPARVVTHVEKQAATLALLVDRSRSMQVTDALGGRSRWQALQDALDQSKPLLESLDEDLEIKLYTFDSTLQTLDWKSGKLDEQPGGEQTAIGAALEEVLRREAGKRLVGIALLSDGAQRAYAPHDVPPQIAARRLADLNYPLFTFAFGQARGLGQSRDVAVRDLIANPTVFVKNQLDVSGALRIDGFVNQKVPVQLLFETGPGEMTAVDAKELQASADGEQLPIEMSYVPQVPGEYKLTLRAAPQDGELVTTNNELSTFVTVLKGGLNVLYLEGALRVEQRFLRNSLDASPDIKVDYERFRQRTSWPESIGDRFDRGKYDVYIIGDLDSKALSNEDWAKLAQRVDEGAGLIMLGGYHSFGPGGYQKTALGDVLPVTIDRLEAQPFDGPISEDLHVPGPLRLVPTPGQGTSHPLMQLAPGAGNQQAWNELPPLDGANRFRGLKPAAVVLADSGAPQRTPLLVAGSWGGGRVLAFAGDSTWRWYLAGKEKEHRRFWRQVVLWLARKDEAAEGNVWIKLANRRFQPNGQVEFTVGADTPEGDPVEDAQFQVEIVLPDGTRSTPRLVRQGNRVQGNFFDTQQAGDYTIVATATQQQTQLGEGRARFLVYEQDLELDNPAGDPGLLATLAEITKDAGGKALAAEELPYLLEQLKENPPDLEVETQIKHTYWDTWPFFLVFVGLIGCEWYLRKKWGLV